MTKFTFLRSVTAHTANKKWVSCRITIPGLDDGEQLFLYRLDNGDILISRKYYEVKK